MKIKLLLTLGLVLLANAGLAYELNEENLRLALIKLTPDFDRDRYATKLLEADRVAWRRVKDDEKAYQEALELRRKTLESEVKQLDLKKPFVLSGVVSMRSFDEKRGGIPVRSLIPRAFKSVVNTFRPSYEAGMPRGFALIVPNSKIQKVWPRTEEQAEAFFHSRRDLSRSWARRAYVEVDLQLMAYQQNLYFQAPVLEVRLYPSEKKERLLGSWKEPRDPQKIVDDSWLREGVTLDLVPNHSLRMPGIRILEPINEGFHDKNCKDLSRQLGHRAFRCDGLAPMPFFKQGILLERTYVGGRLVSAEYKAIRPFTTAEVQYIRRLAKIRLQRRGAPQVWNAKDVQISWDLAAMREGDNKVFLRIDALPYLKLVEAADSDSEKTVATN